MLEIGGEINGKYILEEFIAPGGMGEVWKAKDVVLNRNIAIKIVNDYYLRNNPVAIDIFMEEARTCSSLFGHPNVVSVIEVGTFHYHDTTNLFIAMEYVEGLTVAHWINNIKEYLDPYTYYNISLLIAWEICRAIGYSHRKGIIHRDIKSMNIFISKIGITKVGDFGLARFVNALTRVHTVRHHGSPQNAAPEQWRGEKATKFTDYYQLGCTLYQLFTGRLVFEDVEGSEALMYSHLIEIPHPPSNFSDIIPDDLSTAILMLLEKIPLNRKALWILNDVLAKQIQDKFFFICDFRDLDDEDIRIISEITEYNQEVLKTTIIEAPFPDSTELLSESIELILNGYTSFHIRSYTQIEQLTQEVIA